MKQLTRDLVFGVCTWPLVILAWPLLLVGLRRRERRRVKHIQEMDAEIEGVGCEVRALKLMLGESDGNPNN